MSLVNVYLENYHKSAIYGIPGVPSTVQIPADKLAYIQQTLPADAISSDELNKYLLTGLEVLNIQASEQRKIFSEIEDFAHKYMDALKQGPSSSELPPDNDGNFSRPINVDEFTRTHSDEHKKRRGNLPKSATNILKKWLMDHLYHPYPTEDEKNALSLQTSLTMNQISNWFINARRRILQPMLETARHQNGEAPTITQAQPQTTTTQQQQQTQGLFTQQQQQQQLLLQVQQQLDTNVQFKPKEEKYVKNSAPQHPPVPITLVATQHLPAHPSTMQPLYPMVQALPSVWQERNGQQYAQLLQDQQRARTAHYSRYPVDQMVIVESKQPQLQQTQQMTQQQFQPTQLYHPMMPPSPYLPQAL